MIVNGDVMKVQEPNPIVVKMLFLAACFLLAVVVPLPAQTEGYLLMVQQSPADAGTVTPQAGIYRTSLNDVITITAFPQTGYRFVCWLGDVTEPTANTTTILVDAPKIVIAVFEREDFAVALSEEGVCRIDLDDDPQVLTTRLAATFPRAVLQDGGVEIEPVLVETLAALEAPGRGFDLPLDIQGTIFQRRVWAALQDIQPGETASYGEIARQIGSPKAARAVAQACGANNLAVAVPCHRVVRADGGLGGYRWGLERKRALLAREAEQPD